MIRGLDGRIPSLNAERLWIALAFCLTLAGTTLGAGLGTAVEAPVPVPAHSERGGWVEIDNRTDHKVHIHYQSGHGGYSQELGKVAKGHRRTFTIPNCDQDLHFQATARHSQNWEKELHVHCGETAHWQIGGHHDHGHSSRGNGSEM